MAEEIIIKTVLDLSGSEQIIKRQVEKALGGRESAEERHLRRIESLTLQHANRLQQIEARKQSQIDAIRERGLQKELEHQRKIERETQRAANAFGSMRAAIAAVSGVFTALAASGGVRFFEDLARRAIDAAVAIDRQVNTLKALTGSAEAATRRFGELFALAQKTPGLTTNLALTLDTQLRILNVTEQTINRILPAIGRLNAIAPLGDPSRFVGNLGQLVTQRFEVQDLRELVGNSPFAGELIKSVFGVNSPTNAKAIREAARKLGIDTVEEFLTAFAQTAEKDPRLKAITESLGAQFEKLQDRIQVALAPVGDELLKTILPAFKEFVEILERDLPKITALLRDNRDEFLAVASAIVTMTDRVSQLIVTLGKFQVAQNLSAIRLLSILGVSLVGGPAAGITAGRAFVGADALRSSSPFLEGPVRQLPPPPPAPGFGGGLESAVSAEARRAAKEREREIKELTKKIAEARDEFGRGVVEDLEAIERAITGANLENVRREGERPGQLRSFSAAVAERIRRTDLETLRLEENTRRAQGERIQRTSQRAFRRSGLLVDDALNRGQITAGEAEDLRQSASRELANQLRLKEQLLAINDPLLEDLREEIELYDRLGTAISDTERFARGFNSAIETTGDAFERFGQNVSNAFRNVRDLFNGLKQAVLGFFNDLLGNALQNIVKQALGPLFGGGTGGGGGILGNIFRTPSFAGGGGITVPTALTGPIGFGQGFGLGGAGGGAVTAGGLGDFIGASVPRTAGSIAPKFSLSGLGRSFAAAAPALGLSIGSSLGGQSIGGQILGGVGGTLFGLSASTGFLGAGLLTNPFTAIAGVGLLIGGALLGKAKQRKQDEEASGQFLTQALQGIEQLAAGVASGQIPGTQARSIFETQILGTFIQQINQLKTKSVRESRLTNQVRDLRNVFESRIPPLIAQQEAKAATSAANALAFSRQIPEFATGGTTRGGLALLHPGEKVLNLQQQSAMRAMAGPSVFERAGVPGPSANRNFDIGGTMPASSGGGTIELHLGPPIVVISEKQAQGIYFAGAKTDKARGWTVKHIKDAQGFKEL